MKNEIEKIIKEHDDLLNNTLEKMENVVEKYRNNTFAQRMVDNDLVNIIKEETDKIMEDCKNNEIEMQNKCLEIINKEKDNIIHLNKNDSTDYALKINNALSFLNATGERLTDDTAHIMLEDFEKDYKTMTLFKEVIENVNGLYVGETTNEPKFPKTFDNYSKKEKCFNILDEISKTTNAALTFLIKEKKFLLKDGKTPGIARLTWNFEVPSDSYSSLSSKDSVLELLEEYTKIEI